MAINRAFLMMLPFFLLFAACIKGEEDKKSYPVLGKDPVKDVAQFEDHNEALARWAEMGIRDAVLINIDTHDDMKRIQPVKLKKLQAIFLQKDWAVLKDADPPDSDLISAGNFIFAAAKLGIIKEVYWIIPYRYLSSPDAEEKLRLFLASNSFISEDINTFQMQDGCFSGLTGGVLISICGTGSLPDLNEPVILSVDMDYFPVKASVESANLLGSIKLSFDALFQKSYSIRDAVVAYSVNGLYMPGFHRWIGDEIVNILARPDILSMPEPPALAMIKQNAEMLRRNRKPHDLMNLLAQFQGQYEEPSILMYIATAYNQLGKVEESFDYAEKACRLDRNYCFILPEFGARHLHDGRTDIAERFFLRGYDLNPDMNYMKINFALYLKQAGRYKEALKYFKIFRKWYDPYPVDLLIGETYLLTGDDALALQYFDSGSLDLATDPYAYFEGHEEEAHAIRLAVKFYEKKGYLKKAEELRNSPKLRVMFEEQAAP